MRYESHLAPPPHLVGLRIAALDALLGEPGRRARHLRGRARREGARTRTCARTASRSRRAACSTSRRRPTSSWPAATSAWTRSRSAASSRSAATSSTSIRRPRSAPCAASCSTWRWSASPGSPRSRSARSRRPSGWRSPRPPSWRPSTASSPRSPPRPRSRSARTWPRCCRWTASASCSTSCRTDALVAIAAEEELAPALRDYWEDVTTSFHDEDAHHLYVKPEALDAALDERARLRLSSISQDQPHEFRAQSADTAARSLRDAEPELEKLVRSGYRTFVAWSRRGEAERAQLNMARMQASFLDGKPAPEDPSLMFAHASLRDGFIAPQLKLAVLPEHRLLRRRRAERPAGPGRDRLVHGPPRRLARRARGPRHRALHRLRDEDRGRRDARLPRARVPRRRPRLRAERPAPQDQPLRGRRRGRPAALEARRQAVGADEAEGPARRSGARRRADQPLRRAQAPRGPRLPARQRVAARVRGPLPVPRDARPARGDRGGPRRHGGGAPDGPPDLRRRGLRQDRGGAARGLQGGRGRQAGDVPGADDRARPAALRHLPGAPARLPVPHRDGVALPLAEGRARVAGGLPRGEGRHPDRHAPACSRATCGRRSSAS